MNTTAQRVAWITGGGSGIGRALALRLARAGWTVAVSGRRLEMLEETARLAGAHIRVYPLDVTDLAAVRQSVRRIEQETGPIELAVLNAGLGRFLKLDELSAEVFAEHMRVNYLGAVHGIDALLPALRTRHVGHIVITASLAGYRGLPGGAAYAPTKAALISLAQSLRFSLEPEGIRISVCNPGYIKTAMTDENHFRMPFLMDVDDAAERLYRGILRGKFEITFPTRLALLARLGQCLPFSWYFSALQGKRRRRHRHG
ncbi:MAG: SDR family NAD(P)-dependent oxidoreductase [Gammaproteobacteria bacterium]|nr:SDR family NAD(P)-dependent oxidoreductase [Gammaproteobacteria bacterium]MDE2460569.1 SDR family NAD(P)-dependent oxidoreductase [Gammaproteobacteria bacterium]